MPRMRIERNKCEQCVHYGEEGISQRCFLETNLSSNWLGVIYLEHPDQKNILGRCPDYKEIICHNTQ
jgi:hypothetical protein